MQQGVFVIHTRQKKSGSIVLCLALTMLLIVSGLAVGLMQGCQSSERKTAGDGTHDTRADVGGDGDWGVSGQGNSNGNINSGEGSGGRSGGANGGVSGGLSGMVGDVLTVHQGEAMRRAKRNLKQAMATMPLPDYLAESQGPEKIAAAENNDDSQVDDESRADAPTTHEASEEFAKDSTKASAKEPSLASQRAYVKGRDAYLQGRRSIPEAIRLLDQSLRLTPDQPDVLRLLGQVYTDYGNAARGAHYLRQAVGLNRSDIDAVFALGQIEFHQGRWSEAAVVLYHGLSLTEALAEADPGTEPLIHFYLASALERLGYDAAAIKEYQAYLQSSKQLGRTSRLARELFVLGRQHSLIWQSVGDAYHRLKRPSDALEAYQRAEAIGNRAGDEFVLTQRLVYTLARMGRLSEAQDVVVELIRAEPDHPEVLRLLSGLTAEAKANPRLSEALEPIYQAQNRPAGLALILSDLLGPRQGLALLEAHLVEKPADRAVFERLIARRFEGLNAAKRVEAAVYALRVLERTTRAVPSASEAYAQLVLRAIGDEAVLLSAFEKLNANEASMPVLRMMRGMALERVGRSDEAIAELEAAMGEVLAGGEGDAEKPTANDGGSEFEAARVALARLLAKRGDFAKAMALLEPLADRTDSAVVRLRVQLLVALERMDEAVVLLDQMIAEQPRHVGVTMQKADLQIAQGKFLEAEQTLQDALNRMPKAEPIYDRLFMLYDRNLTPDAVRQYQKLMVRLLGEIPQSRLAKLQNARMISARRDFGQAEAVLKSLLSANANDFEVIDELLDVYVRSDRAQEAEALLTQRLADDAVPTRMLTVALQHYNERVPDADKKNAVMERLLKREPAGAARSVRLAELYLRTGREQEAVTLIEETFAGEIEGGRLVSLLAGRLGEAMVGLKIAPEKVDARMEKLVAQFPEDEADIRFEWARLVESMGDAARGEQMMIALLIDFPDHATTNNNLGYNWANQGIRLEEAQAMIERAVEAEPASAAYLDSLGWVHYKRGNFEEAVLSLSRARQAEGGFNPVILDHLGDALYRLGRREEAVKVWRDAQRMLTQLSPEVLSMDPEIAVVAPRLSEKMQAVKGDGKPAVAVSPGADNRGEDNADDEAIDETSEDTGAGGDAVGHDDRGDEKMTEHPDPAASEVMPGSDDFDGEKPSEMLDNAGGDADAMDAMDAMHEGVTDKVGGE